MTNSCRTAWFQVLGWIAFQVSLLSAIGGVKDIVDQNSKVILKKVKLSCAILVILWYWKGNLNKAFLRTSKANKIRSALFSCFAKLLNRSADEVNCLPLVASKHTSVSLKRDPLTSAHTTLLAKWLIKIRIWIRGAQLQNGTEKWRICQCIANFAQTC